MRSATLMLVALLTPSAAPATCLLSNYSPRAEFLRSDYVAKVRITGETWLDMHFRPTVLKSPLKFGSMPSGLDPYAGVNYRAELLKAFKGKLPRQFNIYSENTTARVPLRVGEEYLVFLSREPRSDAYVRAGALTIDNCGNSGLWQKRARVTARVHQLAKDAR